MRDALAQLPELVALIATGATKLDPVPAAARPRARRSHPSSRSWRRGWAGRSSTRRRRCSKTAARSATGYDATVDECRGLADGGKTQILAIEEREQRDSGIASLKVRYNRVFGYYIEITKSHLAKVPAHYARKQTIATGERYVTPELAELEKKVVAAEETLAVREAELFRDRGRSRSPRSPR